MTRDDSKQTAQNQGCCFFTAILAAPRCGSRSTSGSLPSRGSQIRGYTTEGQTLSYNPDVLRTRTLKKDAPAEDTSPVYVMAPWAPGLSCQPGTSLHAPPKVVAVSRS